MIGLIVNPVAGMGGRVGLKGTDGEVVQAEARRRGARPIAEERARRALRALRAEGFAGPLLVAPAAMGEGAALAEGFRARIVGEARTPTTAADTVEAALAMRAEGATLILFAGGDGTARDLHGAVGESVAMLGIPTGVKMHSGVFAIAPEAAGRLAVRFAADEGGRIETVLCEIMDVDEAALRQGRLAGRLYGYGRVPCERNLVQAAKRTGSGDDEAATDGAALEISRAMAPGIAYVVGPGRTAKKVLAALGLEGTLLGVDLVIDGRLAGADLGEAEILALAGDHPLHVIVGVTGGQGFVFGRGNQPISPAVIRRAGGLTILAGPAKLAGLADCRLLVDTGDASLDAALSGYRRVVTGPGEETVMRLAAG